MRRNTSNPVKSYPVLDKVSSPGGDQERILKCEQDHFANYLDSKMNKQEIVIIDKTDDINFFSRGLEEKHVRRAIKQLC